MQIHQYKKLFLLIFFGGEDILFILFILTNIANLYLQLINFLKNTLNWSKFLNEYYLEKIITFR